MAVKQTFQIEEPKKVGRYYENKKRAFSYIDIDYEKNKWADAKKYLPADFDICYFKIKDKNKLIPGWHTGIGWDGLNIKETDQITHWKLNYDA